MPSPVQERPTNNDYTIRSQSREEKQERQEADTPIFTTKLRLNDPQIERLQKEVFEEFQVLKDERQSLGLENKWKELQNVYDGIVAANTKMSFNLHRPQAKTKVNAIVRTCIEAFLEMDPMFSITPRPEFAGRDGMDVAARQTDFLDYSFDEEIQPETEVELCFRQSAIKFVGIIKADYEYKEAQRKRDESYDGSELKVQIKGDQVVGINEGLKRFIDNYPDAVSRYQSYVKRLVQGKKIDIVVDYLDNVANNPRLTSIKVENFYVANSTKGIKGLKNAHLIVERQPYTWWELQEQVREGTFKEDAVDDMKHEGPSKDKEGKPLEAKIVEDYRNREYDVLECTYQFLMNENDEEPIKIKAWFSEVREKFLGGNFWPYYGFDTDYIPFYMKVNDKGFYGGAESVIADLKDSNIAQNAMLNFMLQGAYNANILTPVVKEGSEVINQFNENRWTHGIPLVVPEETEDWRKDLGFVDWPNFRVDDMLKAIEYLSRQDGDVTGVSDILASGDASELDPNAPGNKTIALLKTSGANIKEYIKKLSPSFNEIGSVVLQMYYQMSNEDRKFRAKQKAEEVAGEGLFDSIKREQMVARTNIQARATAFAFDKLEEKRENMAAYGLVLQNAYASGIPEVLYKALRLVLKSWNPTWKNQIDNVLPSPEEFSQTQMQVAVQATIKYFSALKQQEEQTGLKPQADLNALTQVITQAQQVNAFPELQEENK